MNVMYKSNQNDFTNHTNIILAIRLVWIARNSDIQLGSAEMFCKHKNIMQTFSHPVCSYIIQLNGGQLLNRSKKKNTN